MRNKEVGTSTKLMLLAGLLAGSIFASQVYAQPPAPATKPVSSGAPARYMPDRFAGRAAKYYALVWGIAELTVKVAESGELVRFNYRVLNPNKAKPINDKDIEAFLYDPERHIQLVIPSLEKVGKLRQSNTPKVGTSYWMAFSNPGRPVKRGDRVNVVIGQFHADGLVVE